MTVPGRATPHQQGRGAVAATGVGVLALVLALALLPAGPAQSETGNAVTSIRQTGSTITLLSARRQGGVVSLEFVLTNRGKGAVITDELIERSRVREPDGSSTWRDEVGLGLLDPATGQIGSVLRDGRECRCTRLPNYLQPGEEVRVTADVADPGGEVVDVVFDTFHPIHGVRPEGAISGGTGVAGAPALLARSLDPLPRVKAQAAEVTGGDDVRRVDLRTDVLFKVDKAELTPKARATLRVAADALLGQPKRSLGIYGHTDDTGTDAHNLDLSRRRAEAVRKALMPMLGSGWRVEVRGFGESRPVAANQRDGQPDPQGRARNRRVEVVVLG